MGRPQSPDPAERISLTFPRSVRRLLVATASAKKLTTSAFLLELIRRHFQEMAAALDGRTR
jgi:hypothetical protein